MSIPEHIRAMYPRAPTQEEWDRMAPAEREAAVAALPTDFPAATPPESGLHFEEKARVGDILRRHFKKVGRTAFVGAELPVYYPGESVIAPDVVVVLDVPDHRRMSWNVAIEKKGIDFALEILVAGDRKKDLVDNPVLYARLGIPEYVVFDVPKSRLHVWTPEVPGSGQYKPRLLQAGRFSSDVLGLELAVEGESLQFLLYGAPLPGADDLIRKLDAAVRTALDSAMEAERRRDEEERRFEEEKRRREEEQRRREEEQRRREEEQRRREAAERRVAELEALLKGSPSK